MTATAGAGATGSRRRSVASWLVLAVVLLVVGFVAGTNPSGGRPLAPDSTAPDGAKGMVDLLRELGADVEVVRGPPADDADTAVLLDDRLADSEVDELDRWVDAGGRLLVADPSSPLASRADEGQPCPSAFDDVDTVVFLGDEAVDRDDTCSDTGFVASAHGDGWIIAVDDPTPFTNALLDEGDNAVLAAAVLAPTGTERVAFVDGSLGPGRDSLYDLLPTDVRQALIQLGIAFVILVLFAGRRLGQPVLEQQPVAVEGAELVTAVGRLLDGRRRPDEAAAVMRAATRRSLASRLGLSADAPPEVLAAAVHTQTGIDPARVAAALATRPVASDADLVAVATELDHIRRTTLGGDS